MNHHLVRELFLYDNGTLFWNKKVSDKIVIGQRAGNYSGKYITIKYKGKTYQAHRLVWMYFYKTKPETIDHINNNFKDNRIENLRPASYSQNLQNTRKLTPGHSKFKGVTWDKRREKWIARIKVGNKRLYLGQFDVEKQASEVYNRAARIYFGEFAVLNKIGEDNVKNSSNR